MLTFLTWSVIIAVLTVLTVDDPSLETMVAVMALGLLAITGVSYLEHILF